MKGSNTRVQIKYWAKTGFKTRFTMMPSGMCKPMTAVAAMMLDRQKALPLDAPQSCKAMSAFEVKPNFSAATF